MALPIVIAKNQTGAAIVLPRLGIDVPASPATLTLTDFFAFYEISAEAVLFTQVGLGNIVINDGTDDLTAAEADAYLDATGNFSGPASGTDTGILVLDGTSGRFGRGTGVTIDSSDNIRRVTSLGLKNGSFDVNLSTNASLTADRSLLLSVNDANRAFSLSQDLVVAGAGQVTVNGASGGSALSLPATVTFGGNFSTAAGFTVNTAALTLNAAGGGSTITLPSTGTVATLAGAENLSNKTFTTGSGGTFSNPVTFGGTTFFQVGSFTSQFLLSSTPALTGNVQFQVDLRNGSRGLDLAGNLTLAGSFSTSGAFATTLTVTGATGITLPTTGTLSTLAGAETLSSKTLTAPTINGGTATALTNFGVRSTGTGAFDMFLANSEDLTAGRTFNVKLNNATRTLDLAGTLQTTGGNVTLTGPGTMSVASGVQGDLMYHDGVNWGRFAPGTSGQFLRTGGAGVSPVWATPSGGGGNVTGPGSSTTTAIARYGDTSGTLLTNSGVLLDASNNMTGLGYLELAAIADPAAPASGSLRYYGITRLGTVLPFYEGSTGPAYTVGPAENTMRVIEFRPALSTTINVLGITLTVTGTVTTPTLASTNRQTASQRWQSVSTNAAGNLAGVRGGAVSIWRGNAAGLGGFTAAFRWGLTSVTVAGQRTFVGLYAATAALTNVDPSTLLNMVGMGMDAADTNMQIMHNDGAGTATKINLGANFVKSITDVYTLYLRCTPNGGNIDYYVVNETSGNTASGTISTDLPAAATFMNIYMSTCNNANTGQVGICGMYTRIESFQ